MILEAKVENKVIYLLTALQSCHMLDFVIMMPLGPMFMRLFNISPAQFGLLVSSYTFSAAISGFLSTMIADRFDRKKFLLVLFAGFIMGTFLCGLALNFHMLLIARIIAGAFGGVIGAQVFAIIGDLIQPSRRGKALGMVMTAFSLTSVIGVPIGVWLATRFGWNMPFLSLASFSVAIWLICLKIIPTMKDHIEPSHKISLEAYSSIFKDWNLVKGIILVITISFSSFLIIPYISPYVVRTVGMSEQDLALIYLAGGSLTFISSQIVGRLCDRLGTVRILTFMGSISLVAIYIMTNLPVELDLPFVLAATSFFMIFISGRMVPTLTTATNLIDSPRRGRYMSLTSSIQQIATGSAALVAGLIVYDGPQGQLLGYQRVGFLSIFLTVIALILIRFISQKK